MRAQSLDKRSLSRFVYVAVLRIEQKFVNIIALASKYQTVHNAETRSISVYPDEREELLDPILAMKA